jgi:hypothetical protein
VPTFTVADVWFTLRMTGATTPPVDGAVVVDEPDESLLELHPATERVTTDRTAIPSAALRRIDMMPPGRN